MILINGSTRIKNVLLTDLIYKEYNLKANFNLLDKTLIKCASTEFSGLWSEATRNLLAELVKSMESDVARLVSDDGIIDEDEKGIIRDEPFAKEIISEESGSDLGEHF